MNRQSFGFGALTAATAASLSIANTTSARSAPSGKPIVIGAAASLTGRFADGGNYTLQGYQLWVKQQNTRGGLLGRPVALKYYDDQSEPSTGVRLYEKLVTEDHVDLLAGPYGTALTAPASNVAARYKMVMFCAIDAAPDTFERGNHYIFQGLPQAAHYVDGVMAMAKARGLKTIVLIGDDSAFPHAIGSVVPELAKNDGLTIAYTEYYPHSSSDYSSTVLKVKGANPDVILAASMVPDSIGLVRQLKTSNVVPKMLYMAVGGSDPVFGKDVGKDADGVLATTSWSSELKTQGNADFIKAFRAEFGRDPEYHSAGSFAGLTVLGEAVQRVKAIDQEKVRDQLASMKLRTVLGTYAVDPATGKQIGYQAYVQQWQGGRQVIVYPPSEAQAKLKYPLLAWNDRH